MQTPGCVIVVHGGAGPVREGLEQPCMDGCQAAALAGWEVLQNGGTALDAVQRAVEALEDNPLFNAGTGATLNAAGKVQLDASIMDGSTLAAGAVASVTRLKHPVSLARRVLEDGRHVLLVGEPALDFARAAGIAECTEQELIVEHQRRHWHEKHGTVGSVALDQAGRIAAATSTGGIFDALPGRVGDSPLIGCGTYADELGGVSCTGIGEAIIRTVLAKTTVSHLHAGLHPLKAVGQALTYLDTKLPREAGLIVVDREGRFAYGHNTSHMPVCVIHGQQQIITNI